MTDKPTVICAWCRKLVLPGGAQTSHGICRACAARFENDSSTRPAIGPQARS